jgi:carbonic anhydrase
MENSIIKLLNGYRTFRNKYATGDQTIMESLSHHGQKPEFMIVACCDARVDPALILQCDPGELFVVRNVANIIPPYEKDGMHHGTSAALEFGVCHLQIKHLILLGHSQCGGIATLVQPNKHKDDFITDWVTIVKNELNFTTDTDKYAQRALKFSLQNCLTFPWLAKRTEQGLLRIHLWYFDIKTGTIFTYDPVMDVCQPL